MLRYVLTFLAGALTLGLIQWVSSDRTGKRLTHSQRKTEAWVTIYVNEDPSKAIPGGNVSEFLKDVAGLKDEERRRILDNVAANFISRLQIEYRSDSPNSAQHKGIWFDVVDGKFSKAVGTYGGGYTHK